MSDALESRELWERLEPALDHALDLDEAPRAEFLARLRRDDPALHLAIIRILDAPGALLERGALSLVAPAVAERLLPVPEPALQPGAVIGRYRIVRPLGEGGMGIVYLAERHDGDFQMPVALKLVRSAAGGGSHAFERRFLHERRILARLSHPNIARLLDGGVADDGRAYYVMEFVDGDPLVTAADRRHLSLRARLALFADVCAAVQYAHETLVIHRDLKPSNILVTGEGQVKLLDFGIAKLLDADSDSGVAGATVAGGGGGGGTMLLSPPYASPEQLRGEPVSTASDVYSLGVVLYELLTGARPVDLGALPPPRWLDALAREDAPPPSSRSRLGVPRDLDAIVAMALRFEPVGRYRTVAALAADVRRFLDGLPVEACAPTWRYRAAKFWRRHRVPTTAAAIVVVLASAFAGVTVAQDARIRREATAAIAARDRAQRMNDFLVSVFEGLYPYAGTGGLPTPSRLLDSAVVRLEREYADRPEERSELLSSITRGYQGVGDFAAAIRTARRGIAIERALPRADSALLAVHLLALGQVLSFTEGGTHGEAELRESLALRQAVYPPNDVVLARGMGALAVHLARRGASDEAERLVRSAMAIDSMQQPNDPQMLAQGHRNLGHALRFGGRPADAASHYARALTLLRDRYGEDNPEVGNAMINLGVALHERGGGAQRDSARALVERGVAMRVRLLGAGHDDLIADQVHLAMVRTDAGEPARAESLLVRVLPRARALVPGGMTTAMALRELGRARLARGDRGGGCALLREQAAMVAAIPGLSSRVRGGYVGVVGGCGG